MLCSSASSSARVRWQKYMTLHSGFALSKMHRQTQVVRELGLVPTPVAQTIRDTVTSMLDLGLVKGGEASRL